LRRFLAEVAIATGVTAFLVLTRCYCNLFLQVLPLLYLAVLFEITMRYAFLRHPVGSEARNTPDVARLSSSL